MNLSVASYHVFTPPRDPGDRAFNETRAPRTAPPESRLATCRVHAIGGAVLTQRRDLADILVDTIPASARDRVEDVVEATLSSFVEQEERESQENVDLLRQELLRGGLAVAGVQESRRVLTKGRSDMLVLTADYTAEQVRVREQLLRLAESTGAQVDVVQQSDFLQELGGVGCLLRYKDFSSAATRTTQPGTSREKSVAS